MILLIDNYDSFVFNLAIYIKELGYEYLVKRNNQITCAEITTLKPSLIILSPGPCAPNEAGICLDVVKQFHKKIPILGVCLGHQVIGQAFGGIISRAKFPMHGKARRLNHDNTGLFQGLPNPLMVGRYHSLIIEKEHLPTCLRINALSEENEIMAIQHKEYPVYGVQFHPESILTEAGHSFLKNFINLGNSFYP
ncbi:MAG: aminodeoxychorismate/anthranilate synthase component II [Legionella sp.]|nr:aminodeoxychorismate/anthranilate synthase component II [Legionella sp.]